MSDSGKRRALITGITGQDGSYLAEFLVGKGYDVHGLIRRTSLPQYGRINHLLTEHHIALHHGDLADAGSLLRVIKAVEPDEIYNLAAQSHVGLSFEMPEYTTDVTGVGALRVLEAVRVLDIPARVYQASSSEIFGRVEETPQRETTAHHPRSPYAFAKAFAFNAVRQYRESYGLYAVNGILFNHESPRRGENFVTRKITSMLAHILAGKADCLFLGNLDAKRDWGYAPEYVEGMWMMLQQDAPDDYVLATGRTASVRDFLEICLGIAGIPFEKTGAGSDERYIDTRTGKTIVAVDPLHKRPSDVEALVGDASKAKRVLGWEAKTSLEELARMMMEADSAAAGIKIG